jgi:hypothetical protein
MAVLMLICGCKNRNSTKRERRTETRDTEFLRSVAGCTLYDHKINQQIRFFLGVTARQWARASSLSRLHDHNQTHHTRYDSSGRVNSPTQGPPPENTQHSQEPDTHAPRGIRTSNPTKTASTDPRLRPHGHWDRPVR